MEPAAEAASPGGRHELPAREEWKRIGAIVIPFAFTIMFWAAYEQKGASATRDCPPPAGR